MSGTHCDNIIRFCEKHNGKITPMDAIMNFGCTRLGARIWDMEMKGYNGRIYYFNHRMVYTLNQANKPVKYMEYTLYGYREVEVA